MPADRKVLANEATQLYGIAGFLAILLCPLINKHFKLRIPVILAGEVGIIACLAGIAASVQLKNGYSALAFIIMFQPSYMWGMANVHWPYISEVTNDVQFGFISFFHYM